MNIELIKHNLSMLESEYESGREAEACTAAFSIARLVISQAKSLLSGLSDDDRQLREVYRSLIGALNEMNALLADIKTIFDPLELTPKQKEKIRLAQEEYSKSEQEFAGEQELNAALLLEEEALRESRANLTGLRDNIRELTDIKEKEIDALQNEINNYKMKLEELEDTLGKCEELAERYRSELGENSDIVKKMPDTVGIKSVDDLISYGRQFMEETENQREDTEKCIQDIIAEIEKISRSVPEDSL